MLSSAQILSPDYLTSSVFSTNPESAEQEELISSLLQLPYLVMVRWLVTRGKATGEWVIPPHLYQSRSQKWLLVVRLCQKAAVPSSERADQVAGLVSRQ